MKNIIKTLTIFAIGVAVGRVWGKKNKDITFQCETLVLDGPVTIGRGYQRMMDQFHKG